MCTFAANCNSYFAKMANKQNQNYIEHTGLVVSVSDSIANVRIQQQSACAACHAKGMCSAADVADKILEVSTLGKTITEGQQVQIAGRSELGMQAVLIAYVIPFVLMLIVLFGVVLFTNNEVWGAIASLSVLFPYYGTLFFFRGKIKKQFSFFIKQIIS